MSTPSIVDIQIQPDGSINLPHGRADFAGYVTVTNQTGSTIDLQVTPYDGSNAYPFSYSASGLANDGTINVPVDTNYPTLQLDYTPQGGTAASIQQTLNCRAGEPKVQDTSSTNPSGIACWNHARCSGPVKLRSASGNNDVYFQLPGGTIGTLSGGRNTSMTPQLSDDTLSVSLNSDMSNAHTITIIHQDGSAMSISDPGVGQDFETDTFVVSADTSGGQSATLTVQYPNNPSNPDSRLIEVDVVGFDGTSREAGQVAMGGSLSFSVTDADAYLAIGGPPDQQGSTPQANVARTPLSPDAMDDQGLPQFLAALTGDPTVLIKHVGYVRNQ